MTDTSTEFIVREIVREIVERSLSPDEGSAFPEAQPNSATATLEAEQLLARWEKLIRLKTKDKSAFNRRLQHLGLDRTSAIAYLKTRHLPTDAPSPNWANLLSEVLAPDNFAQPVIAIVQLQAWCDPKSSNQAAFPEFLHPFLSVILRQIRSQIPNLAEWVSNHTVKQIADYALLRLSKLAARVIAYEVKQWRFKGKLVGETPEERYQYFVQDVLGTPAGLTALFLQYPVLARLLAVASEQIITITVELLQRLQQDFAELSSLFQSGESLGTVTSLQIGLSDLHQEGRTVCILQFASGLKLVYKPRRLEVDQAFNTLITWLNQTGVTPTLRPVQLLARSQYGWSEFIASADCTTQSQVSQFYQRQGVHTALMYFLCGMDFHWENFIAAGEFPVPIDLEAVLATGIHSAPEEYQPLPKYLHPLGTCSLLTSNLSFFWRAGATDQPLFCGTGINGCGDRPWHTQFTVLQGLGTDEMKYTRRSRDYEFNQNLPRWQSKKISVNDYIPDVVQGFTAAYRILWQHREELLQPQGLLATFRNVTTRTVIRDSNEYAGTLSWSLIPDHLTSGANYDIALELLYTEQPAFNHLSCLDLLNEEKRCCWQQSIPVYYSSPESHHIYSMPEVNSPEIDWGVVVTKTSFEQMQQRFQSASAEDLIWQSELLRVSLEMAVYPRSKRVQAQQEHDSQPTWSDRWLLTNGWSSLSTIPTRHLQPIDSATKVKPIPIDHQPLLNRLQTQAIAIGEAIVHLAMNHAQGNSWLYLSKVTQSTPQIAPVHPFPWHSSGAAGTSIFLANLAQQTGNEHYEQVARGALKFTAAMLEQCIDAGLWDTIPISGYNGLGLWVYALTENGRCFQDEALLDSALDWALKLTPERLRQEQNPDVLAGAAGALLVLLHLYKLRPDRRLIDRCNALGESILQCQHEDQGWRVPNFERSLLGMAHGVAGIAYALLRLYRITGSESLRQSAVAGLAYERSHFCPQAQDWSNLQQTNQQQFMQGWCAGASGIGLARLGSLGILQDDSALYEEIEWAIAATQRHLGKNQHHLCCGEAGRILFLATAAQRLDRPELFAVALSAALELLDFSERRGYWRLQEFSERNIIPGILDGVAGIGLMLLSLISPPSTSQVLILD